MWDINYLEELEPFLDQFHKYALKSNKIVATSPFREEKHPSFAVNLETGVWIDSGSSDDGLYKGHFTSLLAFLRNETEYDTTLYLNEKYNHYLDDTSTLKLNLNLPVKKEFKPITDEIMRSYAYRHPYLAKRGISEKIQCMFKIGYDKKSKSIVIPHFDKLGNIINLKFRKTMNKRFWYLSDGQPIKEHLYGFNFIKQMQLKEVVIVEGEVDCMYLWTHDIPAIATSGAYLSKKQEKLILNSCIETLIMATDNDTAGKRFENQIIKRLGGNLKLKIFPIPEFYKDVNDMTPDELMVNFTKKYTVKAIKIN